MIQIKVELEGRTAIYKDDLFGFEVEVNVRDIGGQADATISIPRTFDQITPLMARTLRDVLFEAARFAEIVNGTYRKENYDA